MGIHCKHTQNFTAHARAGGYVIGADVHVYIYNIGMHITEKLITSK